ncbi:hypothetical protein GCM10023191_032210 [Actinoallomurus oryzae]|uniref:Uncharacterized protein n=1 Tax=Actinoallomurus oryzae TaxID=502180 RepID=A0ABP8PZG1_9ACTN
MTERSEGIKRRAPVVTLPDAGGLMTERSEGIKRRAPVVTLPDVGGLMTGRRRGGGSAQGPGSHRRVSSTGRAAFRQRKP